MLRQSQKEQRGDGKTISSCDVGLFSLSGITETIWLSTLPKHNMFQAPPNSFQSGSNSNVTITSQPAVDMCMSTCLEYEKWISSYLAFLTIEPMQKSNPEDNFQILNLERVVSKWIYKLYLYISLCFKCNCEKSRFR